MLQDMTAVIKTYTAEIERLRGELKAEQEARATESEDNKATLAENEECVTLPL